MVPNIVDNTKTNTEDKKLLTESKDKISSIKQQHLDKLKTKTYIIYTIATILATALSSIYFYYAVMFAIAGFNMSKDEYEKYFSKDFILRWSFGAIFTVGQFFMIVLMMCKLRKEFDDFHAEYGCFLRTVITIQALSLLT